MSVEEWTSISDPIWEIDGIIDTILDKTCILDILDTWGVKYSVCRTGDFTHKSKCPLELHAFGDERTASFFVSEETNKFYCFGCNSGGNIINLIELYLGKPFYEAAKWLLKFSEISLDDIDSISKAEKRNPEEMVLTHVYRSGILVRDHLHSVRGSNNYEKWCKWADKRFNKLDEFLYKLSDDDWKIAKAYYEKIDKFLTSRKI